MQKASKKLYKSEQNSPLIYNKQLEQHTTWKHNILCQIFKINFNAIKITNS